MACNTSAQQYVALGTQRGIFEPVNGRYIQTADTSILVGGQELNITSLIELWVKAELKVLDLIAPLNGDASVFLPSCQRNNLSYIKISYNDNLWLQRGTLNLLIRLL